MLVKLFKYLCGYVKIRMRGNSPERLMNLCNAHGMLLWGVENKDTFYEMYISIKDFKRLRPFVKKTGTKILLLEKHGLPFFLYKFRMRKMFFGGIFVCIFGIYLLSLFVWNIQIDGNITQTDEELLTYLESMGVVHGLKKSRVRCGMIESNLRNRYPNMLWVSAELRGTRIIVQIKENTDKDIVSEIHEKEEEPMSLIAEKDGIVESMIVRQGSAAVSVGDAVKKGQVLVEGYYVIKNDAGEIIRYEGVTADADICLSAVESYEDVFSISHLVKQHTGRKRLGIKVFLLDKKIEFLPKIPFGKYETAEKKLQFHITENFYLPVSLSFQWYDEYTEIEKNYTKEEIKKNAEQRCFSKYQNILQKGVQIIEKDVKIKVNGKLCIVRGNIKLHIPVSTKVPAAIPEILNDISGEGEHSI